MSYKSFFNTLLCILVLSSFCVFNNDDNTPLIMTRVDTESDTVPIWPRLIFELSVELKDSIIPIVVSPDPGAVYSSYLNEDKDTLIFLVTGSLKGSTSYSLTLEHAITAKNGNRLEPQDAVFKFVTFPAEGEPNNIKENADTLLTKSYGILEPANDTDCFYMFNTGSTQMYLKSLEKKSGFVIRNSSNEIITQDNSFVDMKTFDIGSHAAAPVFIYVYSLFGNDARYELGIIP